MTVLLDLEPRIAGTDVIEPSANFAESVDVLHDRGRCQDTILCEHNTRTCPDTGPPA